MIDKHELWEGFWKPLIINNGKIDIEILKDVLYDEYFFTKDRLQEAKEIGLIDEDLHLKLLEFFIK